MSSLSIYEKKKKNFFKKIESTEGDIGLSPSVRHCVLLGRYNQWHRQRGLAFEILTRNSRLSFLLVKLNINIIFKKKKKKSHIEDISG